MLSQRLMPTMDTTDMPDLMPMVTDHMDTQLMAMVSMERDLLMPSKRLMPTTDTLDMPDLMLMALMAMDTQLMAMVSMERDLLMPSQRLMLTTDMPDHTPMDMPDTDMVVMDVSGDKLNSTQLRSSKATTNINDTQFPKNKL